MSDDGAINLRVVMQLKAGNGPVFNAGERVEVTTSTLWTGVLLAVDVLTPLRLEWVAVLAGVVLTIAGVVFACAGASRLWTTANRRPWIPLGLVAFGLLPSTWEWSSAGLEGGLTICWLGLCLLLISRPLPQALRRFAAVAVGLGPLVRPDLAVYAAGILGLLVWEESGWIERVRVIAGAAVIPCAYQVFRMGYYGLLVPNTALAKDASGAWWGHGWIYLRAFVTESNLLPILILLTVGSVALLRSSLDRRSVIVASMFAVAAALHTVYIVRVGGDWMFARMLIPPYFALVAPVFVVPAARSHTIAATAVLAWMALAVAPSGPHGRLPGRFVDVRHHQNPTGQVAIDDVTWSGVVDWGAQLRARVSTGEHAWVVYPSPYHLPPAAITAPLPGPTVGTISGIGYAGYAAGPQVHIDDTLGLANIIGSHIPTPNRQTSWLPPGHEKQLPIAWSAARFLRPGTRVPPALDPGSVDAARAALRCPGVAGLLAAAREPLSLSRFWSNVVGARERTGLEIPADPLEAARCGLAASPP